MDYSKNLKYHFRPRRGWVNDPNGLVFFRGYYHVFYQHSPDHEIPWKQPMHWGHARTRDFLNWEELPVALFPDADYDRDGCWSGTAIVKDDTLYLFYASVRDGKKEQTVSVACSSDGVRFEKCAENPVIGRYPPDGGPDFRDPAVCCIDGRYYCVMATGNPETKTARLLLYTSGDLLKWEYSGVMCEWENCRYAECPSIVPQPDGVLVTASVCPLDSRHYFMIMYGRFENGRFTAEHTGSVDNGPDQYAGQVFSDHLGRNLLISWMPGWEYAGYAGRDIGCMSAPRELKLADGRITGYPVKELQHLLADDAPCLRRTDTGFIVERTNREPLIYRGDISDLKILRDEYFAEIFVNGGEQIFSVLL